MHQKPFSGEFREGMPFLGGSLWIDFVNTTPVIKGTALDLIGDASALERWARQANIETALANAPDDPAALQDLRAQLADAFDRLAASKPLPGDLIATINHLIQHSAIRRRIVDTGDTIALNEHVEFAGPPVASAVAWHFAQFLGNYEHQRLRHCDNPACTMQFYDVGKNNRRRWCTMALCGNRDKVAQYRGRKAVARAD
ncbi:putative RNA-binding Zn ribbon-like protein [Sphingomonas sp. BE270]|jgi:predicted RNA-binding Zn ribbon-like protein|uniref:CGNR zinc finger domain-containing protein n=2 Tax=Sphingomonas TaxID=13687 RepID=UPI0009E04563|nr:MULTISPECIES: CGNR zinc finger domain-containing protein [unclassified Sphingomonas]MDR7258525.1 putative RNA-binding Zn ribbon-like protein [Sphingomonas sp. BE270]